MSTGEKRKKSKGREYESPPPIPCMPKELDVLLDKWMADRVFKSNNVSREPTEDTWSVGKSGFVSHTKHIAEATNVDLFHS